MTLRVLMFGWEFPPFQAGGLGTATRGLVRGLVGRGVEVTLVVPFEVGRSELRGLRLVGAQATGARRTHRIVSPLAAYGGAGDFTERLARALRHGPPGLVYGHDLLAEVERYAEVAGEIAAREPHDLIDAHDWITFAAGLRACDISGRPLVAHIHATEEDRAGEGADPHIVARERGGLRAAARVISNSHRLKRRVVQCYGVPPDRIDVVHFGIEPPPGPPGAAVGSPFAAEEPVVLFVGRVTWQKGPGIFLEVARRVADLVPRARFLVVGTGDRLPATIERAVELGLAERVHFAGPLDSAEVGRAYRLSDVCVMPSLSEPLGLVALESLRHGTPCIVPRTAGVAEVVRHAFRVDVRDVEEIADKVVALLRHRELREELSRRGAAELGEPRFGLDEPAAKTVEAYRRALARPAAAGG